MAVKICCVKCHSDDVTRDATARWSVGMQEWELAGVMDQGFCVPCDAEVDLIEVPVGARAMADKINVAAITDEMIAIAVQNPDLDAALLPMMDAAGITTGDLASVCFSGFDILSGATCQIENRWEDASADIREEAIREWIATERRYAETEDEEA